jgi:AraC-like DNA-binding protein
VAYNLGLKSAITLVPVSGVTGKRIGMAGHYFRPLRNRQGSRKTHRQPSLEALLELVSRHVVGPFARLTGNRALAVPLELTPGANGEDPVDNPSHPACAEYADSDYCRESWQYHLAELAARPQSHWHRCDYDKLCAFVPVVHENRCLAAVKLAASSASLPEEEFELLVELLDSLVAGFVLAHADFLGRLPHGEPALTEDGASTRRPVDDSPRTPPSHPQVLRAMEYIREHLSDPKLTVCATARALDMDASYLGNIFADQVGQRMSWYIAAQRVERAKTLLATTHRQVKAIARDTGHANTNWFCHVFRVHTGLTPNGYRRQSREQSRPAQGP